jgi:nucleoside 2-deoxyribosyltransferase
MKIYLAYRFTGEDPAVLDKELGTIVDILKQNGHQTFCSFWKEKYYRDNNFSNKEVINYTLPKIDTSDALIAYIKSDQKSEGMLLEIGYALGKSKPVIVVIKEGITTNFVTDLASQIIRYQDFSELENLLPKIK